ncbi:six-hairpin glycosidase [uncultured Bacteroides sp.]|uniref:six-hairpin glycosidase n=1 Tax=uncultured Bacteroides sp. TaxID=162156 RepID=UPI002AA8CB47|nr:six-hairpin glycosidase [uncultured Bacteroides sp.]
MKTFLALFTLLLSLQVAVAQHISLPDKMLQSHPRVLTTVADRKETLKLIKDETWAEELFAKLKQRTDVYADRDPEWLTSRLQMYWKSHATDVYIKGEFFDHAGGEKAPAPTVQYVGARSHATNYARPELEDIMPYSEDSRGIELHNNALPGSPLEWADISKTGMMIASVNTEIMGIARDAAFLWWITGEKKYGDLAAMVFDTYMTGIYYRNVPKDLNHGHQQTLVGMTSFEVIHEDVLNAVVPLYDFLYDYLKANKSGKMAIYADAFKKWADNIIDNGVPHNNWNLIQARFIMDIGLILEDNRNYGDNKGREYYLDYVLNQSSIRQWSLTHLADYGFDAKTGIWAECPGYSCNVVADYANFADLIDRNLGIDLVKAIPVIEKAVAATPQYLFPNRMICGFGDTHPDYLRSDFFARMVSNAQQYGKKGQERRFTEMFKLFNPQTNIPIDKAENMRVAVTSFFSDKPLTLNTEIPAGKIEDYVTPTFYAPNVSWFVQRNGMDVHHSLMISQNASEGNHMHANGISMELYGKGFVLGPDAGIGQSLYSGLDYLEYYGQFPAHNTVCVDGISGYPIMKSNHAFDLRGCYPAPQEKEGIYKGISYSDVSFREPESRADQTRLMSIITTGPQTGYYVDIFRSRKERGGDKMHDYFYHNLGQSMKITAADGSDLNFQPTQELAFAGGHLYAYSYIYNKKSVVTNKDIKATFTIKKSDGDDVFMNMWMRGERDREIFAALSPVCDGLSRAPGMPYSIKDQPTLTFVARQKGEAWMHPFVSIFEPSSKSEPSNIASINFFDAKTVAPDFAGICVTSKDGRIDYIFSQGSESGEAIYGKYTVRGTYAVVSLKPNGDCTYFLGNGTEIESSDISIEAQTIANIALEKKMGKWYVTSSVPCTITIGTKKYELATTACKAL